MNEPTFDFTLPAWLEDFTPQGALFSTDEEKMQLVIEASRANVAKKSGGPFAAAVFESQTGKLVSLGVNLVTTGGLSILHAEIIAISLAQKKLGTYDLSSAHLPRHELVSGTEPCTMCLGAILWSGVTRLVTGATSEDAQAIGFDEGPRTTNWKDELQSRGIEVVTGVQRSQAGEVLRNYQQTGGVINNPRKTRRP